MRDDEWYLSEVEKRRVPLFLAETHPDVTGMQFREDGLWVFIGYGAAPTFLYSNSELRQALDTYRMLQEYL